MPKAADTLAWLQSPEIDAAVMAHPGAAFEERELLVLMLGGASGVGGVMSAAYRSKLASHVPSLEVRTDARAYAHVVMFAADFGLDPVTHPAAVSLLLDDGLHAHENDTDTLGELLIACHLLGHKSPAVTEHRGNFDAAWAALPRTFEHYHPILVGGILYALTGD